MTRRWVRYEMPVAACVEISDTEEHEQVTKVVAGTEADDLQLARDHDGRYLVYDEHMERVSRDALRDPWLYEDGDGEPDFDQDETGEGKDVPIGYGSA
jgi:hypothetical protein